MAIYSLVTTTILTLVLGVPALLAGIFERSGRALYRTGCAWAWLILKVHRVRLQVAGVEKLVRTRSYVFISNHLSHLDGLAMGSVLIASATFAILTYIAGNAVTSSYLGVINVKGSGELTVFCGALVGASLGFLWFNCNPAEVFMGDVGSMALGGAIGTVAVLIKQEVLLIFVGGLFVMEAFSVILQVASFKMRGRRIFRMAPLHHRFELGGWPEPKVIIRFWIIAIIFALISLSTLKLR